MPKSVLSRRRSFVARFTALAMVASIMVIGAAPASAAVDTSDACPVTTPSAGFTDIGAFDATTQRAIDCLVSYGISQGTSTTTYSPTGEVTRWQMALFLTRQASLHDIDLPSGAPQGFTDIAGLNAATQTAINQLAQLGITAGTSASTFSPNESVPRWQMALFIARLADAAPGMTLPPGAPQGFTDLGGLSNEAQTAINQLAAVDIADGTSATTFSPLSNVNRWQMALFLTRTLQVEGVTPTEELVTITPDDAITLNSGQARTYTATFQNADGSAYTAQVGIRILDVSGGNPVYNHAADGNTEFEAGTDGVTAGTETFVGFPGPNGSVTFTIRNTTAENVAIVAWQDTTADASYGTSVPSEPFDVTATQTFSSVAPAAADSGSYTGLVVGSTIKASNTFTAGVGGTDCGNGLAALCTFSYDSNDIFEVEGVATNQAGFAAALSASDILTVTYDATAAGQSTFDITTDNTVAVAVTTPAAIVTVDAATFTLAGTADPGATVRVYNDVNDDGDGGDTGEGVVQTATATADGTWTASVSLVQNADNDFAVTQVPVGGTESGFVPVFTITEGPNQAATITGTTAVNNGTAGTLDPGDTIAITFSEAITGVGNGDTVTVFDGDGTTATLTVGTNVTAALSGGDTVLTLTVTTVVPGTGGTGGIQTPSTISGVSGFQGVDGLAINLGSGPARTFTH